MIRVGDIMSYVWDRLDLSGQAAFSDRGMVDSFYRHLNNGIKTIAMRWPVLKTTDNITAVVSAVISLPTTVRILRIESITWPTSWKAPEFLLPQQMREIVNTLNQGSTLSGEHPQYWSFNQGSSPYIELQDASLCDDESITITYSFIYKLAPSGLDYGKNQIIEMPEEYEHLLSLFVTRAMAPKAMKDIVQILYAEYNDEFRNIEVYRTQTQHNEVDFRPKVRF